MPQPVLYRFAKVEPVCSGFFGVPLPAPALQFVVTCVAVAALIVGTRSVTQLRQRFGGLSQPIPPCNWSELKRRGLVRDDAPVLAV